MRRTAFIVSNVLLASVPMVAWAQSVTSLTPVGNINSAEESVLTSGADEERRDLPLPRAIRLNGQVQFRVDDPVKMAPVITGSSQHFVSLGSQFWFDFQVNATLQGPPGAVTADKLVQLSKLNGATSAIDVGFLLAYRRSANWGGWLRFGGSANFQIAQVTAMDPTTETTAVNRDMYGYGQADVTAAATLGSVTVAAIGKYQKVSKGTPDALRAAYDGNEDSLSFVAILPLQFQESGDKTFFLNVQWDPFSESEGISVGFSLDFRLDRGGGASRTGTQQTSNRSRDQDTPSGGREGTGAPVTKPGDQGGAGAAGGADAAGGAGGGIDPASPPHEPTDATK